MLVPKEIVRPGTYWYTDQKTGKPAKLVVTPAFIDHLHNQGRAMLRAGLSIPVPFEHQPDATPQTPAQRAAAQLQNNAGWVRNYYKQGNRLFGLVDIADPAVAAKLPTTIKFTSPWISSFTDGSGKTWDGVIGHLALTSRPRIVPQEPFPSVAAALSILPAEPTVLTNLTWKALNVDLSLAGLLIQNGDKGTAPALDAAFAVFAGVKLAEDPPPDPKAKKPGEAEGDPKPKPKDGDMPPVEMPGQETDQGAVIDSQGNISVYQVICDALGVDVPAGGSDENSFLTALYKHCMEQMKAKGLQMSDTPQPTNQPPNGTGNDLPPNPIVQEQPPMYMSLDQINAIPDATMKAISLENLALRNKALTDYGVKRQGRIDALAKNLPQQAKDTLLSMTKAAIPTLKSDGSIDDPAEPILLSLEQTISSIPDMLKARGINAEFGPNVKEQPHPEWGGEMSADRMQAVLSEFAGGRFATPAAK